MARSDRVAGAERELRESRVATAIGTFGNVIAASARRSRVGSGVRRLVEDYRSLPLHRRRRLIVLAIGVAIATHLLMGLLVPKHLAPLWLFPGPS